MGARCGSCPGPPANPPSACWQARRKRTTLAPSCACAKSCPSKLSPWQAQNATQGLAGSRLANLPALPGTGCQIKRTAACVRCPLTQQSPLQPAGGCEASQANVQRASAAPGRSPSAPHKKASCCGRLSVTKPLSSGWDRMNFQSGAYSSATLRSSSPCSSVVDVSGSRCMLHWYEGSFLRHQLLDRSHDDPAWTCALRITCPFGNVYSSCQPWPSAATLGRTCASHCVSQSSKYSVRHCLSR